MHGDSNIKKTKLQVCRFNITTCALTCSLTNYKNVQNKQQKKITFAFPHVIYIQIQNQHNTITDSLLYSQIKHNL